MLSKSPCAVSSKHRFRCRDPPVATLPLMPRKLVVEDHQEVMVIGWFVALVYLSSHLLPWQDMLHPVSRMATRSFSELIAFPWS